MESEKNKLDLSGKCLKKIPRNVNAETVRKITELNLDNNELMKFEGIEQFTSVVELSASHNNLVRMFAVSKLHHLVKVDFSYNNLLAIEGLKEAVHLKILILNHNRIKAISGLKTNVLLEYLDLSENLISHLDNLGELTNLKKLMLHKNCIETLRNADSFLPISLEVLTLAGNKITDLNEISNLASLKNLVEISITANPCMEMTGNTIGFDYRPFLVNWLTEIKIIDGFVVDEIESLKAEWLYSQGRGRQFKTGQHEQLVQYLADTCPLTDNSLQSENEKKLRLILSKAHHHQLQLKMSEDDKSGIPGSANNGVMTRSLDPSILSNGTSSSIEYSNSAYSLSTSLYDPSVPSTKTKYKRSLSNHLETEKKEFKEKELPTSKPFEGFPSQLPVATKFVPVPESLVSPMVANPPQISSLPSTSEITPEKVSTAKLQTIKTRAQQKKVDIIDGEKAAIRIQKIWRGYKTRNLDPKVLNVYQKLRVHRTFQTIQKLSQDMEATREILNNEHRLQVLQMQAINALWKKVCSLQLPGVQELAQMCDRLNSQVQQLQISMQDVLRCVSPGCSNCLKIKQEFSEETGTQTDIVAVESPITDGALTLTPFVRPSSLPLTSNTAQQSSEENSKLK